MFSYLKGLYMHAVFLDYKTVDANDLDLGSIKAFLPEIMIYSFSNEEEVLTRIEDAEVAIANKVVFDAIVFARATKLKLICVTATGTNNIDLEAAKQSGVVVCNIRDYCTDSVVQHVLLSILTLKHSSRDYSASMENGDWQEGSSFSLLQHPIAELAGKSLGIVGYGVLGQGVARAAETLGLKVLISESFAENNKSDESITRVSFDALLAESDIISLHCPLTDNTTGLFDEGAFEQMKSSAILINTARGGLIDDHALIKAIKNKTIAGAAIDVLNQEPPDSDHPLMQKQYSNLIITPHIAWAAREARQRALDRIAENIDAFLKDKPINVVNA
ncbi:MAG TPA: D-2-hydroxyacid dehydrogenase [Candidatus Thioglobus sp.]|nr:D-2-hydroxyacid dehydrogenase [Candidatus Thioglobus sp.]HIK77692.1 D-2-hydroxyacid dehydrogenase [Gammaproteobacteria bacterium]